MQSCGPAALYWGLCPQPPPEYFFMTLAYQASEARGIVTWKDSEDDKLT